MRTHEELAHFISEKLTKKELLELTKMLDGDSLYDFIWCIYLECEKRAPEAYREAGLHFVEEAKPAAKAKRKSR